MPTSSQILAKFAAELGYSDLPAAVVRRAKDCIIDTVATATFGSAFRPWSRIVVDYGRRYGSGGMCSVLGFPDVRLHTPYAALANGTLAHAFEHDSVREPSAGIHPGATLVPAVLAACEETGADGKTAITAFVAGCEVAFRIAASSHHSPEKLGFHAPGLTGPYGATAASGKVFGLDSQKLAHALGIAGSLSAGILAFTNAQHGAMVKRLHFGRSAEAGILAARLAQEEFTGPETVLDGKFGFLDVYCRDADLDVLTANLKIEWETLRVCLKRYPCHLNAQTSVQALRVLMAEHLFIGSDVASIAIDCSDVVVARHNNKSPNHIMDAQYSVPFCVAIALFRDPDDPASFDDSAICDPMILNAARNIVQLRSRPQEQLEAFARAQGGYAAKHARLTVTLKDGREFSRDADSFKGMPNSPFSHDDLKRKFVLLCSRVVGEKTAIRLFDRLDNLEAEQEISLS